MWTTTHPVELLLDILQQAKRNSHLSLEEYTSLDKLLTEAIDVLETIEWEPVEPMDWE